MFYASFKYLHIFKSLYVQRKPLYLPNELTYQSRNNQLFLILELCKLKLNFLLLATDGFFWILELFYVVGKLKQNKLTCFFKIFISYKIFFVDFFSFQDIWSNTVCLSVFSKIRTFRINKRIYFLWISFTNSYI